MPGVSPASFGALDEGSALTRRPSLNFVGSGVTATDDSANNRTLVTVSAGGTVTFAANSGLPVFNVKSSPYSALGNDSADDTTAIQAAITAAAAAGSSSIVFFPPGTYRYTSLTVPSGVQLLGGLAPGVGSPILKGMSATADSITLASGGYGNVIRGLDFRYGVTRTAGLTIHAEYIGGRFLMEGCLIHEAYNAISVAGNGVWMRAVDINNTRNNGLKVATVEGHFTDIYLENSSSSGYMSAGTGIDYWGGDGNYFSNISVIGFTTAGVNISAQNGWWNAVAVDACYDAWVFNSVQHDLVNCYAAACTIGSGSTFPEGRYGIWFKNGAGTINWHGGRIRRAYQAVYVDSTVVRDYGWGNSGLGLYDLTMNNVAHGVLFARASTDFVSRCKIFCHSSGTPWNEGGFTHTNLTRNNYIEWS